MKSKIVNLLDKLYIYIYISAILYTERRKFICKTFFFFNAIFKKGGCNLSLVGGLYG